MRIHAHTKRSFREIRALDLLSVAPDYYYCYLSTVSLAPTQPALRLVAHYTTTSLGAVEQ